MSAATNADQHTISTTTTLFVSRLPDNFTSDQLSSLASSYGPVRKAFIVNNNNNNNKHTTTSIGYVRYVLRADAEEALKNGFQLVPRPLIDWAKPRPSVKDRRAAKLIEHEKDTHHDNKGHVEQVEPKLAPIQTVPTHKHKRDPDANRTVVVQGLPLPINDNIDQDTKAEQDAKTEQEAKTKQETQQQKETRGPASDAMTKALYKRARKLGNLESVLYPAPSTAILATTANAHLKFVDQTTAARASTRLHLHVFKGSLLTTVILSRWQSNAHLGPAHAGGRLIVRNLDFNITSDDLRYIFGKHGPIQAINIHKGFAFVWMVIKADAERAMAALNGQIIKAGEAKKLVEEETAGEKKSIKRKRVKTAKDQDGKDEGRVMAVDWALGKREFLKLEEEERKAAEEDCGASQEKQDSHEDDEDDGRDGQDDDEDDQDDDEDDQDDDEDNQDDASVSSEPSNDYSTLHQSAQGTTLFVRNLSFEATEDELYALFKTFGPIRYARIVVDPKTQRSRGTGFVCLWNRVDADKVLEVAKGLENQGFGQGPLAANGLPSLLQPDPSSGLASKLSLHGRVLGVSEAVTKNEAERLRVERDRSGSGKDKRNLYLMKEGLVLPSTPESKNFDPADLTGRQTSFDERKALLRTNFSLYISKTRLSFRQLPLYVSDRSLKRLSRHALASWRQEVKSGARPDLSTDEKRSDGQPKQVKKAGDDAKREARVKQAKVIRDSSGRAKKSKGYGFVELGEHSDALKVVRWVTSNILDVDRLLRQWTVEELEGVGLRVKSEGDSEKESERRRKRIEELLKEIEKDVRSKRLLMVEFAIENAQTVKKRLERKEMMKHKQLKTLAAATVSNDVDQEEGEGERVLTKRAKVDHQHDDDHKKKKKGKSRQKSSLEKVKVVERLKEVEVAKDGKTHHSLVGRVIGKKRKIRRDKKGNVRN